MKNILHRRDVEMSTNYRAIAINRLYFHKFQVWVVVEPLSEKAAVYPCALHLQERGYWLLSK